MQKPALLKIVDQFGVNKRLPLVKRVFTIGRKPGNDLMLLSSAVSRDHGAIVYDNEAYYLVDKESKSGLFVNGKRVTRCELHHQDNIVVGGHEDCQIQFLEESLPPTFESSQALRLSQPHPVSRVSPNQELEQLARYVEVHQAFKFSLTPDDVLCL